MRVTDTHVELLRALLTGDREAASRAQEQAAGNLNGLAALVEAAFGIAARRAFAPSWTMPGVIRFAARVRIGNAGNPVPFGALDAERELRRALGDKVPPPGSYPVAGAALMCMLETLVTDLELDDAGLAGLLGQARGDADRILAHAAP
jgi:hypothetical protein